jgi:hypothetical protein
MGIQKFADRNITSEVPPRAGTIDTGSAPPALKSSPGKPRAVRESEGTENLRAETTTKQAPVQSTPTKSTGPSAPQHFDEMGF